MLILTKLTFANGNIVIMEDLPIGNVLPAKIPTLKKAALLAVHAIRQGSAPDCAVTQIAENGDLMDVTFENGALLTVPADYTVTGYAQALQIVIDEIRD